MANSAYIEDPWSLSALVEYLDEEYETFIQASARNRKDTLWALAVLTQDLRTLQAASNTASGIDRSQLAITKTCDGGCLDAFIHVLAWKQLAIIGILQVFSEALEKLRGRRRAMNNADETAAAEYQIYRTQKLENTPSLSDQSQTHSTLPICSRIWSWVMGDETAFTAVEPPVCKRKRFAKCSQLNYACMLSLFSTVRKRRRRASSRGS